MTTTTNNSNARSTAKPANKRGGSAGYQSATASSGKRPRKISLYGQQLREKQDVKEMYGLRERQFRLFFERARKKGDAGENLLRLLELRLDNVIYRLGLAKTRRQARQMVSHGHIAVNDRRLNIPSYQVRVGDIIKIRDHKKNKKIFVDYQSRVKAEDIPGWLNFDLKEGYAKVLHAPAKEQLDQSINSQAIVEFYSK